jgi:dihydroorotate dehydrogenase
MVAAAGEHAMIDAAYRLMRPLILRLDAERAHQLTVGGLSMLPVRSTAKDDPRLAVQALGMRFPNPIGLAAGFDKNADVPDAMLGLGFGFVEVGTATPKPQAGNSRPRLFRSMDDRAVVNRMGFNNEGLDAAKTRLSARAHRPGIVGVNVGANKDTADRIGDYALGVTVLAPFGHYVTINISSPNTPGLRGLQNPEQLSALLHAVMAAMERLPQRRPVLVKVAPDLDEQACADIVAAALAHRVDGLIVSNTTIARPDGLAPTIASEAGGLSGAPLMGPSTAILRTFATHARGRLCLIGAGGVSSGADAYAKIKAGATLVQLYSALVFEGPGLIARIKRELLRLVVDDGFPDLKAAIAAHHKVFS